MANFTFSQVEQFEADHLMAWKENLELNFPTPQPLLEAWNSEMPYVAALEETSPVVVLEAMRHRLLGPMNGRSQY